MHSLLHSGFRRSIEENLREKLSHISALSLEQSARDSYFTKKIKHGVSERRNLVNHNICLFVGDVQFTATIHTKFPTRVTYTNLKDVVKPEKLISTYLRPQKCMCRTLWFMIVVNHNICLLVGDVQNSLLLRFTPNFQQRLLIQTSKMW